MSAPRSWPTRIWVLLGAVVGALAALAYAAVISRDSSEASDALVVLGGWGLALGAVVGGVVGEVVGDPGPSDEG